MTAQTNRKGHTDRKGQKVMKPQTDRQTDRQTGRDRTEQIVTERRLQTSNKKRTHDCEALHGKKQVEMFFTTFS